MCVLIGVNCEMTSFMKEDPSMVPLGLLSDTPPLPFEISGMGQLFHPYNIWARVKCPPQQTPVRKGAGHRLCAVEACVVPARGSVLIHTGVSLQLPSGHYGKIEGCLELGMEHSLVPFGGIIDEYFCDEIVVKLFNHDTENYVVRSQDHIAQLIVHKYVSPSFHRVVVGGFGSIGGSI